MGKVRRVGYSGKKVWTTTGRGWLAILEPGPDFQLVQVGDLPGPGSRGEAARRSPAASGPPGHPRPPPPDNPQLSALGAEIPGRDGCDPQSRFCIARPPQDLPSDHQSATGVPNPGPRWPDATYLKYYPLFEAPPQTPPSCHRGPCRYFLQFVKEGGATR